MWIIEKSEYTKEYLDEAKAFRQEFQVDRAMLVKVIQRKNNEPFRGVIESEKFIWLGDKSLPLYMSYQELQDLHIKRLPWDLIEVDVGLTGFYKVYLRPDVYGYAIARLQADWYCFNIWVKGISNKILLTLAIWGLAEIKRGEEISWRRNFILSPFRILSNG